MTFSSDPSGTIYKDGVTFCTVHPRQGNVEERARELEELYAVRAQRDELAEALRTLLYRWQQNFNNVGPEDEDYLAEIAARAALRKLEEAGE